MKRPVVSSALALSLLVPLALVSVPEAGAAQVTARFVAANCTTGAVSTVGTKPKGGVTVDGVTATLGADGIPSIAVSSGAHAVTSLGSADLVKGKGRKAKAGDTLTLNYCGIGVKSKVVFDSSYARGGAVRFPLNQLIAGWQKGVPGMRVGGTRLLVVPGSLAYGSNPPPGGSIKANETLAFVITLQKS